MVRVAENVRAMTREKLLAAAADEFARAGLDAANINRISLAAGFAKGTVYNYFPSKQALFAEVIREGCARAVAEAEDTPDGPTRARLRALLVSDMRWVRRHPAFARILLREALSGDPARAPAVLEAAAPFLRRTEQVLREGVKRGEVRRDVPVGELALWFVGLDDLAVSQHFASNGAWPTLDFIPDLVIRQFLEGASARGRPVSGRRKEG